jgi:hypothetical protein
MMRASLLSLVLVASLAGCASNERPSERGYYSSGVLPLGDHFETPKGGSLFVISVQDEYRLIRCIPSGPIAGCYEDMFTIPSGSVHYNRWMRVETVPGLELAIVSPTEVAFRVEQDAGTPR